MKLNAYVEPVIRFHPEIVLDAIVFDHIAREISIVKVIGIRIVIKMCWCIILRCRNCYGISGSIYPCPWQGYMAGDFINCDNWNIMTAIVPDMSWSTFSTSFSPKSEGTFFIWAICSFILLIFADSLCFSLRSAVTVTSLRTILDSRSIFNSISLRRLTLMISGVNPT